MTTTTPKPDTRLSVAAKMAAAMSSRLLISTSRRFAYPFAPALARGLGVEVTAIASLIALNQATAVIGLGLSPLGDRFGPRRMMLAGVGVLSVGMLWGWLVATYAAVLFALVLAGLGKNLFDPAIQAYVGERVPLERRGLVVGVLESSWALSTLVGVPLVGLLMERRGWQAPFPVLCVLGVACLAMLLALGRGERVGVRRGAPAPWRAWPELLRNKAVVGMLAFSFFAGLSNDGLFVVFGIWLEESFHLSLTALGAGAGVIGAAELAGAFLLAVAGDRMGLRRSMIWGMAAYALSTGALPLLGSSLFLSLAGLFLVFMSFEFTVVACLSLATSLVPGLTATFMSGYLVTFAAGRLVGALLGVPIWRAGGLWATGSAAAVFAAAGLACALWLLPGDTPCLRSAERPMRRG